MEALQILKFIYKKERLNFTEGMMTSVHEQTVTRTTISTDEDLLAKLFTDNPADTTDKLLNIFAQDDSDHETGDDKVRVGG